MTRDVYTHTCSIIILLMLTLVSALSQSTLVKAADTTAATIATGKALAFDRVKGNCLACHMIVGGEMPGNIGPPLINMRVRYPDIARLRAQIWDAAVVNPNTAMPPIGRHRMLTEQEIDQVTAFIWSQ